MWSTRSQSIDSGQGIKVSLLHSEAPVSYQEVLQRWQDDEVFRSHFMRLLAECPLAAYRWETPPITSATANRPFEFVLLDSPELDRRIDRQAFAAHFGQASSDGVVEFANLGNDAVLIVPSPVGPSSVYGHLGAFSREAPESQRHALWGCVGAAMQRRLSTKPVWLSTAGGGVSWLHVRLDDRPKYYAYAPYRQGR